MGFLPSITRCESNGVTLLADAERPCGVTLAFTERTGGVSAAPYASLNLGDACGDRAEDVAANRRRALDAIGAGACAERLVNPRQVHGDEVVVVREGTDAAVAAARRQAREGADAVVCLATDVPVLLCYADCVPVVLVAPGGFAVVHSGWRGTDARIAAKLHSFHGFWFLPITTADGLLHRNNVPQPDSCSSQRNSSIARFSAIFFPALSTS